jgi:hypothetical protein
MISIYPEQAQALFGHKSTGFDVALANCPDTVIEAHGITLTRTTTLTPLLRLRTVCPEDALTVNTDVIDLVFDGNPHVFIQALQAIQSIMWVREYNSDTWAGQLILRAMFSEEKLRVTQGDEEWLIHITNLFDTHNGADVLHHCVSTLGESPEGVTISVVE